MRKFIYTYSVLLALVFVSCGVEDIPVVPEPEPPGTEVPDPGDGEEPGENDEPGENEDEGENEGEGENGKEDEEVEVTPEWSTEYFKVPEASEDGWIRISRPEEMAAFLMSEQPASTRIKIVSDLDMSLMPEEVISALGVSRRSFTDLTIEGSGCTVSNYTSDAFLSSASGFRISDIVFDNVSISSDSHYAGAVVNELRGSAVFRNVTVRNSAISASAASAGGFAGFISRMNAEDRQEELNVSFEACRIVDTEVSSEGPAGKMAGVLSGYDFREVLSFDAECSASDVVLLSSGEPYSGPYVEGNEGEWLRAADFTSFSSFLGDEIYGRGSVIYGNTRFVPQWDGHRQVMPLAADPSYDGWESGVVIYSSYDLASLQGKSLPTGKYYLLADVDMGGDDGHIFESIADITYINGVRKEKMTEPQETLTKEDNHTIYNVKVVMEEHVHPGAAFILHTVTPDTRHLNLNFVGADIYNGINLQEGDLQYGNAYAGTLVSMVEQTGHYTVNNVHCSSGVVEAVCKMGGLIGHMCGDSDVINCSVDDYIIRNSRTGVVEEYNIGPVYAENNLCKAYGSQWWYTEGDAGGLIGFIAAICVNNAYIKGCSVTDTKIDCYGCEDKYVPISVYIWRKENYFSGPEDFYFLADFYSLVAGRHVNQFIGAVDSDFQTDVFVIEDYYVSGNSYFGVPAESAYEYNHQYAEGQYCDALGCAYYVGLDIVISDLNLGHYGNYPGTLKFKPLGGEWVTVTEAPGDGVNMAWTGGGLEFTMPTD